MVIPELIDIADYHGAQNQRIQLQNHVEDSKVYELVKL